MHEMKLANLLLRWSSVRGFVQEPSHTALKKSGELRIYGQKWRLCYCWHCKISPITTTKQDIILRMMCLCEVLKIPTGTRTWNLLIYTPNIAMWRCFWLIWSLLNELWLLLNRFMLAINTGPHHCVAVINHHVSIIIGKFTLMHMNNGCLHFLCCMYIPKNGGAAADSACVH